ncbi:hypothetical protein GGI42DRAFT_325184 [Trichoderma sp. SZMC 28013]
MRYWGFQRECQNAALIHMIRSVVETSTEPIYLKREPKSWKDAARNLHAFSTEGSREPRYRDAPDSIPVTISSLPRFRECFGWMSISGAELCNLDSKLRPHGVVLDRVKRVIWPWESYFAIVYELISPDDQPSMQTRDLMQAQIDFFWRAGFCMIERRQVNWKGGILLDVADIVSPWLMEWEPMLYDGFLAEDMA